MQFSFIVTETRNLHIRVGYFFMIAHKVMGSQKIFVPPPPPPPPGYLNPRAQNTPFSSVSIINRVVNFNMYIFTEAGWWMVVAVVAKRKIPASA
jgi:hypothetical protein